MLGAPTGSKIILRQIGSFTVTTLAQLSDVDISGVQDGDVLIYNASAQKFESGPIDCGSWT